MSTEELFSVLYRIWFAEQFCFLNNQEIFQLLILSLGALLKQLINHFYVSCCSSKLCALSLCLLPDFILTNSVYTTKCELPDI